MQSTSPASATGAESRSSGPVLVVDDDEDIREVIAMVLEEEGVPIATAADGAEAIARLRRTDLPRPCLILLDLMMPVMNAEEFRAELEKEGAPPIPIVILSGDAHVGEKAASLGAADAIAKPISLERLLDVVGRFR